MKGLKRFKSEPRRGLRLRFITEITRENKTVAKMLSGFVELSTGGRHRQLRGL